MVRRVFLPMMILLQLPRAKRNFWVGKTKLCRAPKPATDLGIHCGAENSLRHSLPVYLKQ